MAAKRREFGELVAENLDNMLGRRWSPPMPPGIAQGTAATSNRYTCRARRPQAWMKSFRV